MVDGAVTVPDRNPFWTYSLMLYEREGVASACLDLQDRLGLDVNLLLFCCWAGSRGRALSADEIESLIAATRAWRDEVVRPLRAARRWLKARNLGAAARALRADIKASEFSAEAIQQALMREALPVSEGSPSAGACAASLRTYLAAVQVRPTGSDIESLAGLLGGACPDISAAEARRLMTD